jgi:hypothetical protein
VEEEQQQLRLTNGIREVISQTANVNSSVAGSTAKLAIITIDDGYKGQFTSAKPILDHYGYNIYQVERSLLQIDIVS